MTESKNDIIHRVRETFASIDKDIDRIILDLQVATMSCRNDERQTCENVASHLTGFKNAVSKLSASLLYIEKDGLPEPGIDAEVSEPDQTPYRHGIKGPGRHVPRAITAAREEPVNLTTKSGVGIDSPSSPAATPNVIGVSGAEVQRVENSKAPFVQKDVSGKPVDITEGKFQKVNRNPLVEPGDVNISP
jgi:hypothetical protein